MQSTMNYLPNLQQLLYKILSMKRNIFSFLSFNFPQNKKTDLGCYWQNEFSVVTIINNFKIDLDYFQDKILSEFEFLRINPFKCTSFYKMNNCW